MTVFILVADGDVEYAVPREYSDLRYWERGLEVARTWYHEEWDGSDIQLALARDIAKAIEIEAQIVYDNAVINS